MPREINAAEWASKIPGCTRHLDQHPSAAKFVLDVAKLRDEGKTGATWKQIAECLSDPETLPHMDVSESSVRRYVERVDPELYRRLRVHK